MATTAVDRSGDPERRKIRELERELRRKNDALAEAGALLLPKKRVRGDVGGRGRRFGHEERDMILGLIDEAVAGGARQSRACDTIGLDPRTLQRWRAQDIGDDGRAGPRHAPQNKLSAKERARVLEIANAPEHRDLSPKQIVPILADEGIYIASESTFYRILREEKLLGHRAPSRPATKRHRPEEYVATGRRRRRRDPRRAGSALPSRQSQESEAVDEGHAGLEPRRGRRPQPRTQHREDRR